MKYTSTVLLLLSFLVAFQLANAVALAHNNDDPCDPVLWQGKQQKKGCLFPLPNDFFLQPDNRTLSGYSVKFPRKAIPNSRYMRPNTDLSSFESREAWSPSSFVMLSGMPSPILFTYSGLQRQDTTGQILDQVEGVSKEFIEMFGFASHANIGRSLEPDSPTILLNADTGELVPHWVEEDKSYESKWVFPWAKESMERRFFQTYMGNEASDNLFDNIDINGAGDRMTDDDTDELVKSDQKQTLLIHPAVRFNTSTRYIVAFRNLHTFGDTGKPVLGDVPSGFIAIRDDLPSESEQLEKRKQHFKDRRIFELLQSSAGIDRKDVMMAWDFTTASLASVTEHLRHMRDESYRLIEEDGYKYEISYSEDFYDSHTFRRIEGFIRVPLFLNMEQPSRHARLVRNTSESADFIDRLRPLQNGWTKAAFIINIPHSLVLNRNSENTVGIPRGSIMQYGHGLFGSKDEAKAKFIAQMANRNQYIVAATDYWGLQSPDLATIGKVISLKLADFISIPERCVQGILNQLLFSKFLKNSGMLRDPQVFQVGNSSVVETTNGNNLKAKNLFYYGISMGGILGSILVAMSEDIKYAALGVPGGPFSYLLPRNPVGSVVVAKLLSITFPYNNDRVSILFLLNQLWDIADPTGYTDALREAGFIGKEIGVISTTSNEYQGKKKLLLQIAPSDGQVNFIAGMFLARTIGAGSFMDSSFETSHFLLDGSVMLRDFARYPYDNNFKSGIFDQFSLLPVVQKRSGRIPANYFHHILSTFQFNMQTRTSFYNIPIPVARTLEFDTHELPRLCPQGMRQIEAFFNDFITQNRKGSFDDGKIRVQQPCVGGCWNLPVPNKLPMLPTLQDTIASKDKSPSFIVQHQ